MPEMVKIYKVVGRNRSGQLVSWLWKGLRPKDRVVYIPGQWVSAEAGPLFAFGSLSNTTGYHTQGYTEVWLAEAVVSKRPMPKHILHSSMLRDKVRKFWCNKGGSNFLPSYTEATVPHGTILCEKIKLIKKVK